MSTIPRAALVATLCLLPAALQAQEKQPDSAALEAMMKAYSEKQAPGEMHKLLDHLVGKWEISTKAWMGPGDPAVETGTSETRSIHGGRFVMEEMKSKMMGQPMNGLGLTGYDNHKKKFVGFWCDDSGTAMFSMEGTYDPETKAITYFGKMDDPMTGDRDLPVKYVQRLTDHDQHVFEIHNLAMGEKSKIVEITYKRVK